MEGSHCDGEGSWTRVAFVNMSVPGSSCPSGLVQYDDIFNTRLCWINIKNCGCNSTSSLLMGSTIPRCVVK